MEPPPRCAFWDEILDYYVHEDCVPYIKESFQLVPYMFSREIIKRVMCVLLKEQPCNMFMIDMPLADVASAYHWIMQNGEACVDTQDFRRDQELNVYHEAALSVIPHTNWKNARQAGLDCRERIERLRPPPMLDVVNHVESKLSHEPAQNSMSTTSASSDTSSNSVHELPDGSSKNYTDEDRKRILGKFTKKGAKIDPEALISNEDLYYLDNPIEIVDKNKGSFHLAPHYLMRVLWLTDLTIVNAVKMVAETVDFPKFDSDDRDDSQQIFQKLHNDSLDALYSLYRCSSHSNTDDLGKDPTHKCLYCTARGHFTVHCMRYMDRELRLKVLSDNGNCNQCGEKNCPERDNHKELLNKYGCPNCRMESDPFLKNHLTHLCNCMKRWEKGFHVKDGISHDLYKYTRDMSMIARATQFWTDYYWQNVYEILRTTFYQSYKTAMQIDRYYYLFTAEQKEAVKKAGYKPVIMSAKKHPNSKKPEMRQECGGGWENKKPKTEGDGNSKAIISLPTVQHKAQKAQSLDQMARENPVPRALYEKMLKFPTTYKNAAMYLFVLNEDVCDVIMSNQSSSSPVLQAFINLCVADHKSFAVEIDLVSLQVDKALSETFHEFSNPEEEQCPFEFITSIFNHLNAEMDVTSLNPLALFEFELSYKFTCSKQDCNLESVLPENHKQFLFSVTLDQYRKKQDLQELVMQVLRSTVPSGHCDTCKQNTRQLTTRMESSGAHLVLFVQRKRINEAGQKSVIEAQVKLDDCVVKLQNGFNAPKAFQLSSVICREDISNRPTYIHLYRTPGGKWFRLSSQTVTKVDPDDAAKLIGSKGIIFHLRSFS